nr:helix-turn-helix domain-containing protein [Endozoicomonas sp.]
MKARKTRQEVCSVRWLGKSWNVNDLADHLGMNRSTLYYRIFVYGWSVRAAIETPVKQNTPSRVTKTARTYTYQGREYTIRELSMQFDMALTTLYDRLRSGWSVAKTVETPIDQRKSRKKK